jgi:hypothetical protein
VTECAWCGCAGTHEPLCLGSVTVASPWEETRRDAHAAIKPDKGRLRGVVLACIRKAGGYGRTTDEVEVEARLSHQTASARVNELRNAGTIQAAGFTRTTRSGRQAVVYRVA